MTLILTAATRDAIVVAADAALTTRYRGVAGNHQRVLLGVQKVFHAPACRCLASSWGTAFLRATHDDLAPGDHPMQLWLSDQIASTETTDASALASALCDALNRDFESVRGWTGIDLACFDPAGVPTRLRVTNGVNADLPYATFEVDPPLALRVCARLEELDPSIAGDTNSYEWVRIFGAALRECLAGERGWEDRLLQPADVERYLQLLVGTIASCRTTLDVGRTIGGEIATAILHATGDAALRFSNETRLRRRAD